MAQEFQYFEKLASLLKSLTIKGSPNVHEFDSVEIVASQTASDVFGFVSRPEYRLWYRRDSNPSLDWLLMEIGKRYRELGHAYDEGIGHALLGLFAVHPAKKKKPVETLNEIILSQTTALAHQFFILPKTNLIEYSLDLGPFKFAEVDLKAIKQLCEDAPSDYFVRYHSKLTGRLALMRRAVPVQVLDVPRIRRGFMPLVRDPAGGEAVGELWHAYFDRVARTLWSYFWDDLQEEQHVLVAAGAPDVDERVLQRMPFSTMLTIYGGIGDEDGGFVVPGDVAMHIEFAKTDVHIPRTIKKLKDEFGFSSFSDSTVHQSLKVFSQMMFKAQRHDSDGHSNEAFLHYVIALDLLFSDDDRAIAETVSRRAAIVTFPQFNRTFFKQKSRVKTIYNARNKYVHEGADCDPDFVNEAKTICRAIVFCLMRLPITSPDISIHEWLKKLDFFASAIEANESVPDESLREQGIQTSSK